MGNIEYSQKQGEVDGVLDFNDPNNLLKILDYLTVESLIGAGFGAIGIYDEDPRNHWTGNFFDRLHEWEPGIGDAEGLYWNTYGDERFKDYYYRYTYDPEYGHIMKPTTTKTPWSNAK